MVARDMNNRGELGELTVRGLQPEAVSAPTTTSMGTHYLRYSSASFLILLAGLVSFPLLTRLLDNTEYGILGYYEAWIVLSVALAKLGAQHSIIRFYPQPPDSDRLRHFATNLVLFPILVSLLLWAVLVIVLAIVNVLRVESFSAVFWCAAFLIPLVVMSSLVEMVFRAGERSMLLTVTRVSKRWLELTLILGTVIFIERSALAVYAGKLAAAALVLVFYVSWLYRNLSFSRAVLDLPAIRASLLYGLPLVANEVASVVLGSIDRVMIKQMMGDFAAVGIYTIGYSLAMNVSLFMSAALNEAFIPVANRVYGVTGNAALRALKDRILLPMSYACIGIAALLWALGAEVLVALSGPGKEASGAVFAAVGVCFALYPLIDIGSYGLLLQKRSMLVFTVTFCAALANIALNLALIPTYGVMGAVYATVISYTALGITNCLLCPRELLRFPQWQPLVLACSCASLLLLTIKGGNLFGVTDPWLRLLIGGWLFVALYLVPVWLLDARLREAILGWRRGPVLPLQE